MGKSEVAQCSSNHSAVVLSEKLHRIWSNVDRKVLWCMCGLKSKQSSLKKNFWRVESNRREIKLIM